LVQQDVVKILEKSSETRSLLHLCDGMQVEGGQAVVNTALSKIKVRPRR
jgi:hypothetical protein